MIVIFQLNINVFHFLILNRTCILKKRKIEYFQRHVTKYILQAHSETKANLASLNLVVNDV